MAILQIISLLASLSFAQSSGTYLTPTEEITISNIRKSVRELNSGKPTFTGLPTFNNGICFTDGCQTGAAKSYSASASSRTVIREEYTSTVDNFSTCFATVSLTISTNTFYEARGTAIRLSNDTANNGTIIHLLIDGAFPSGVASGIVASMKAAAGSGGVGGNYYQNGNFSFITDTKLESGTHSFCIGISRSGGGTADFVCTSTENCIFQVNTVN